MTLHYFIGLFGIQDTCNHYSKINIADSAQPRKVLRGCGLDTTILSREGRQKVGGVYRKANETFSWSAGGLNVHEMEKTGLKA